VEIAYETEVVDLALQGDRLASVTVEGKGGRHEIRAKAVVVAAGGFESNLAWLREAWGPPADNFIVRGTPYNMGKVLKLLLAQGAKQVSDPTQGHCVAIDARSPRYDGGHRHARGRRVAGHRRQPPRAALLRRGEDFWPKRYAIWGRLVAGQPDQIGYSIIDAKSMGKFMPPVFPPERAPSIRELAAKLGLDPAASRRRSRTSTPRSGRAPSTTRSRTTAAPRASRRQDALGAHPRHAALLRLSPAPGDHLHLPGGGHRRKGAHGPRGRPARGERLAAGEIMAGNILGKGYLAGIGMAIGTTFGASRARRPHAMRAAEAAIEERAGTRKPTEEQAGMTRATFRN